MAVSAHVIDANEKTFEARVLQESRTRPVVVDFWAPWCGPCRTLGPILEKLAQQGGGAWLLVKVNTDESPRLSTTYQIQGIPAVKAFRDGVVRAEFVGALPEGRVRAWLEELVPGAAEALVAQADEAARAGRTEDAEADYERALDEKPRMLGALLGTARIAATRGDTAAAERQLGLILANDEAGATKAIAQIRFSLQAFGVGCVAANQERTRLAPDDLAAHIDLAIAQGAEGLMRGAMDTLLTVIGKDKKDFRQRARELLLMLFEVEGNHAELTEEMRGKLARILFS